MENDKDKNNVVQFKNAKKQKQDHKAQSASEAVEPMVNLPDGVKHLVAALIAIHLGLWALSQASSQDFLYDMTLYLGFMPARFTGGQEFFIYTILTPITYALFHGSFTHVGINAVMLAAFGSGFEKMMGLRNLMIVFWGASIIAAGVHFALDSHSMVPMVGASGGVSGLFAGVIYLFHRMGKLSASRKLLPVIGVFVGISIVFALIGGTDGSSIAWAAHIGGFLGGLALTYLIIKRGVR